MLYNTLYRKEIYASVKFQVKSNAVILFFKKNSAKSDAFLKIVSFFKWRCCDCLLNILNK